MQIGIISDIHANLIAFKQTLNFMNPKIDALLFAGDIVGYGPYPNECISTIRNFSVPTYEVCGNHDLAVRYRANRQFNNKRKVIEDKNIAESFVFNYTADEVVNFHSRDINSTSVNYLNNLPFKQVFLVNEKKVYLVHGSPALDHRPNIGNYLFPPPRGRYSNIISQIDRDPEAKDADLVVVGHSHLRFLIVRIKGESHPLFAWSIYEQKLTNQSFQLPKKISLKAKDIANKTNLNPKALKDSDLQIIINPGSVGQARDGTGNSSFAIFDLENNLLAFYDQDYPREDLYKLARKKRYPQGVQGPEFWNLRY